jgi:glutamate racemase
VRHHIEAEMGAGVQIIDTANAVARHAAQQLRGFVGNDASQSALIRLQTTGDATRLRSIASAWLPFACSVEGIGARSQH